MARHDRPDPCVLCGADLRVTGPHPICDDTMRDDWLAKHGREAYGWSSDDGPSDAGGRL